MRGTGVPLANYLRLVRQHWIIVFGLTVLSTLGATAFSLSQTPIYQAQSQMFVSITGASSIGDLTQGGALAQQRVKSYAELVTSPRNLQPVIDQLELPYRAEELASRVNATTPLDTILINVTVTDTSASRARDIANAITRVFPALVQNLDKPNASSQSPVVVTPTRLAVSSNTPISPRTKLNIVLGIFSGLAFGIGLSVLRDTLDRTVKSKDDAQVSSGAPVLTVVGDDPQASEYRLITHDAFSPRAESFRQLRTNIRFLSVDHRLASVVITSAVAGEGKTTTACNLAIALAQAGETVVLIDADLRRPTVSDVFALPSGIGLTSVLLGDLPLNDALQTWQEDLPLRVLTAGPLPPNPSELIGSTRMVSLINSLTSDGVTVVLDSPPLLPVTDAALLARATDGALVVTRAASTHSEQLAAACESLRITGSAVLGVVLNRVPRRRSSSYYGGYDNYGGYSSKGAMEHRSQLGGAPSSGAQGSVTPVEPPRQMDQVDFAPARELTTRVVLPALPNLGTLPAIPPVPAAAELASADERPIRSRPRRDTTGHGRFRAGANGHTTSGRAGTSGHAPSSPINGSNTVDPTSLASGRWSSIGRVHDLDNLLPEPAVPIEATADMIIDADRGTIRRLEPTNAAMDNLDSWHVEWGNLPALIAAPRAELGQNGHGNNGARHRN